MDFSSYESEYLVSFPSICLDNTRIRPSITSFDCYIRNPLDTLKEEKLKSKETIVHCCLHFSYTWVCIPLSLGAYSVLPKLSFALWCCYQEMEDWSGGGPGRRLGFSGSQKCRQSLLLLYLWFINRNIFSCPIHVHFQYEYWIHGCIWLLIHDWIYMLE